MIPKSPPGPRCSTKNKKKPPRTKPKNPPNQRASEPSTFAGVSSTDSPQPQAEVWFGLLNTNCEDSLSIFQSISVPSRNSTALGSIRS